MPNFLEFGAKRKMKIENTDPDMESLESSGSKKQKKSGAKGNTSSLNFDFENPPRRIRWVVMGRSEDSWTPFIGKEKVPEPVRQAWAAAFSFYLVLQIFCTISFLYTNQNSKMAANNDSDQDDDVYCTLFYCDVVSDPDKAALKLALMEPVPPTLPFPPLPQTITPLEPSEFQLPPPLSKVSPAPPTPPPPPPPAFRSADHEVGENQEMAASRNENNIHPFWLPSDWEIKKKTRKNGVSAGNTDKYYHSPDGKIFRSRIAVEAYLSGEDTRRRYKVFSADKLAGNLSPTYEP
ncbi:hypothetical protein ACOSQ2_025103 [Xanthoceras sorbifolium]